VRRGGAAIHDARHSTGHASRQWQPASQPPDATPNRPPSDVCFPRIDPECARRLSSIIIMSTAAGCTVAEGSVTRLRVVAPNDETDEARRTLSRGLRPLSKGLRRPRRPRRTCGRSVVVVGASRRRRQLLCSSRGNKLVETGGGGGNVVSRRSAGPATLGQRPSLLATRHPPHRLFIFFLFFLFLFLFLFLLLLLLLLIVFWLRRTRKQQPSRFPFPLRLELSRSWLSRSNLRSHSASTALADTHASKYLRTAPYSLYRAFASETSSSRAAQLSCSQHTKRRTTL